MKQSLTFFIINFRKDTSLIIKIRELFFRQDISRNHLSGDKQHEYPKWWPTKQNQLFIWITKLPKLTCLISHFSGSEILVSLLRSRVSSCSSSGAWPKFRLFGRSGFLMETSSPPSGPTFLLLLGFRSSPVSWSTSCQNKEETKMLLCCQWKR